MAFQNMNKDKKIIVEAHRGASGYEKDNTFESFEKAVSLKADAIELDIRKTKDGKIVVFHDLIFKEKSINDYTYDELIIKSREDGFIVPLLVDVLNKFKGRILLDIEIKEEGSKAIAKRSRGTPRIANRLVKRVRDYAIVKSDGMIDERTANEALDILQIDKYGLDNTDRSLLNIIANKYNGGPVGIETLATALGEDVKTIEDVYEPYLVQQGFIQRTPRGRKLTQYACNCFNLKDIDIQQSLF